MRMGTDDGPTAAEYLADVDEATFMSLLAANGERRFARSIARSVLGAKPTSTAELAAAVERAVPAAARRHGHVASRTFQALRIAVNDELEELASGLAAARALLRVGGRLVVISYHSGEDTLVKATMRDAATGGCVCPPQLPCVCGATPTFRLVSRGSHKASSDEVARNPRARSSRLRAAERIAEVPS
jgi:16S rRNA (cytosine1402-N4)-methyltransferase